MGSGWCWPSVAGEMVTARRWSRAWKQCATIENRIALSALRVGKQEVSRLQARIAELESVLRLALKQWEVYADSERQADEFTRLAEGTDTEATLFRRAHGVLEKPNE